MPRPASKPMVSKELGLIDLIRKSPELYDMSHALYKNVAHKKVVWDNISSELNAPVDALKKLWKKLRHDHTKKCKDSEAEKTPYDEALAFIMTSVLDHSNTTSCANSNASSPKAGENRSLRSSRSHLTPVSLEYSDGGGNSKTDSPKAGEDRSIGSSRSHLTAISEEEKTTAVGSNGGTMVAPEDATRSSQQTGMATPPQGSTGSGSTDAAESQNRSHQDNTSSDRVLRPRLSEPSHLASKEGLRKAVNSAPRRLSMTPNMRSRNKKSLNPNDPTRAFFDSMALTVASFPQYLQATIKIQICNIVAETEYELSSPKIR